MQHEISTALSEAEKRVISVKTKAGHYVKYSGNPAELSGARFETGLALRRAGAFQLLIKHNASRHKNGQICVEDLDNIPFVTQLIPDPDVASYSFENPCPDTATRVARFNITRATAGQTAYTGVPNLSSIPDRFLRMATLNAEEVETEALAFALTQLSIFENRLHANELLEQCGYDGRKLAPLLDAIEAEATAEDITLVTGRRNAFKEGGLKGMPLTHASFQAFFEEFNILEYRCPPVMRLSDDVLAQMVGTIFIKDPTQRKNWSNHLNQPVIRSPTGARLSGPPTTFAEHRALAEKVLRSDVTIAGIDELSSPTGIVLSADHIAALAGANINHNLIPEADAYRVAEALLADPRKHIGGPTPNTGTAPLTGGERVPITVPRGEDGKFLYWAPPMSECDCGTPDGGRHIKYKWPCAYYRKDSDGTAGLQGGQGQGQGRGLGKGKGGDGKGKKGKGRGGGKQQSYITEERINSAVAAALKAASSSDSASEAPPRSEASSTTPSSAAASSKQSCCVANYDDTTELEALLNSTSLGADLKAFFSDQSVRAPTDIFMCTPFSKLDQMGFSATYKIRPFVTGAELVLNEWTAKPIIDEYGNRAVADFYELASVVEAIDERMPRSHSSSLEIPDSPPSFGLESLEIRLWDCERSRSPLGDWWTHVTSMDAAELSQTELCLVPVACGVSLSAANSGFIADRSTVTRYDLPHTSTRNLADADALPVPGSQTNYAFNTSINDVAAANEILATSKTKSCSNQTSSMPIFRAPIDSGCTATCTDSIKRLINLKECDETFNVADGKKSRCTAIGDMPVLAKDDKGKIFRFTFTNVRFVPDFKYTLISVKQIWRDQQVDSRFADENRLIFPDGSVVPYDDRFKLCAITLVSEPMILTAIESNRLSKVQSSEQICNVGFHNIKSTAHVARLPAAQAGELLHRRCHMGINKIRAMPHVSGDAPKILASAVPNPCVHCAAAQIRKAGHSGTLDAPEPEPGVLHVDLKGPFPLSMTGKYRYVAFYIDEYSRFVFSEFLHDKSEVIEATKRVIAKFNSLVGTPVDEQGVAINRPKVRRLHRDHEGALDSGKFEAFRASELLHSTTSAPHDHDLNPISESTINVISTLATSYKSHSGAPIGFWPEIIRYAVDWHNSAPQASIGSSTADPQISPTQRFQLKQPKVMDLVAFGARTVVLKPPQQQSKTTLSSRGWVGMFLGRSSDAVGTYEVWVPSINRKVRSSSLTVDEEFFPWLGAKAHQPLLTATTSARFLSDHLGSDFKTDAAPEPADFVKPNDINLMPRPSLSALNLFSGPYTREVGLSNTLRLFGWDSVEDFDNDKSLGGGWKDDILNDSRYVELLQKARAGAWDFIMAGVPCKATTVARCFDASNGGGDYGPPQLTSAEYPDGLPNLKPPQSKELMKAKRVWDRAIEIMIAAHRSPRRTTIVLENPSDRNIIGTPQHMADVSHGSFFATAQFKRLIEAIPNSSMATFANCRFDADSQKYITLWYTNDAARVLDTLNGPDYQCNHPPGTHKALAGGRDDRGKWVSGDTAHYLSGLCAKISMAATFARTGDPTPISLRREPSKFASKDAGPRALPSGPITGPSDSDAIPPPTLAAGAPAPTRADVTPRRLSFTSTPVRSAVPSAPIPSSRTIPHTLPDQSLQNVPRASPLDSAAHGGSPLRIFSPSFSESSSPLLHRGSGVELGGGISSSPQHFPRQDARSRSVRTSTRAATDKSIADSEVRRAARAVRPIAASIPETVPEEDEGGNAPYTSFTGTPNTTWGDGSVDADVMEATVASLIFESSADKSAPDRTNLTGWIDFSDDVPDDVHHIGDGALVFEATSDQISAAAAYGGLDASTQTVLKAVHSCLLTSTTGDAYDHNIQHGLRADSPDAPKTHAEAVSRGPPWPAAIKKEFANHDSNNSWKMIDRSDVPAGRRIHKFVWVFKQKRDGSAKARLCVQGCTLEEGIDYDQTFAKPLRHASARGLFAYAARNRCSVRSVDFVAAYLQGDFVDGEVVYCKQPAGSNVIGADGQPQICEVTKPIYGIPQAGRRLQRKVFPWCTDVMGLRQLDDSDDCVFVWDDPNHNEIFAVGIYVDNLQIVHSATLDEDGEAVDPKSFYAKFIAQLRADWDVVDEGPMTDLLGIDCDYQADGSILLHQGNYVRKMLNKFAPEGPKHKRCATPYSADLPRLVIEALENSTADAPSHPSLIKAYQMRVGALMYACTGTRPDLAYAVHQHCRCLSRPTPDLMSELDYVFSYLYENQNVGIRFTPEDGTLRGTADASWEVRASTSGWIVYWHGAPLVWGSRKQKSISLSSCESEIIALSEAAKDVIHLRRFTRGLVPSMPDEPTILSTDNKAARDLSYNPEHHNRSKHIARRHFFIRDMVESHEIIVPLVNTHDNDADFFTKPLPPKRFKFLRRKVMNLSTDR